MLKLVGPEVDVGFVVALQQEFDELLDYVKPRPVRIGTRYYHFEGASDYRCAAVLIGEMGATHAALATADLIRELSPKVVVNVGIAGGIGDNVSLGDVVVARHVDDYQFESKAVTSRADPKGLDFDLAGRVRSPLDLEAHRFESAYADLHGSWEQAGEDDLETLLDSSIVDELRHAELLRTPPRLHFGDVASGAVVASSKEFNDWLREKRSRKFLVVEMEAAGVMEACHVSRTGAVVVRAVSDYGDHRKEALDRIGQGALRKWAMRNALELLWRFMEAKELPHYHKDSHREMQGDEVRIIIRPARGTGCRLLDEQVRIPVAKPLLQWVAEDEHLELAADGEDLGRWVFRVIACLREAEQKAEDLRKKLEEIIRESAGHRSSLQADCRRYEREIEQLRAKGHGNSPRMKELREKLEVAHRDQGEHSVAERLAEERLAGECTDHEDLSHLGRLQWNLGKFDDAKRHLRAAIDFAEAGSDKPSLIAAKYRVNLADVLVDSGELDQAGEELRKAAKLHEWLSLDDRTFWVDVRRFVEARLAWRRKAHEHAKELLESVLARNEKLLGPDSHRLGGVRARLATVLVELGELDRAVEEYRIALAISQCQDGGVGQISARRLAGLGWALALSENGDKEEAERCLRNAIDFWTERRLGRRSTSAVWQARLAVFLASRPGHRDEVRRLVQTAKDVAEELDEESLDRWLIERTLSPPPKEC